MSERAQIKKDIVLFDIDGVIADYPGTIKRMIERKIIPRLSGKKNKFKELSIHELDNLYDFILKMPGGKQVADYFYRRRKPNKPMIDLMTELKSHYYQIFLITAFSNKKLAGEWLREHKIEYDELFTRQKGKKIIEYKIEMIRELCPRFFIDNSREVIDALSLEIPEVQGIHFSALEKRKIKPEEVIKEIEAIRDIIIEPLKETREMFIETKQKNL